MPLLLRYGWEPALPLVKNEATTGSSKVIPMQYIGWKNGLARLVSANLTLECGPAMLREVFTQWL